MAGNERSCSDWPNGWPVENENTLARAAEQVLRRSGCWTLRRRCTLSPMDATRMIYSAGASSPNEFSELVLLATRRVLEERIRTHEAIKLHRSCRSDSTFG